MTRCLQKFQGEQCERDIRLVHNWHLSERWYWKAKVAISKPTKVRERIRRLLKIWDMSG